MNGLLSIALIAGLFLALVAPLEVRDDDSDCCNIPSATCFLSCLCGCSASIPSVDLVVPQPYITVVGKITRFDSYGSCSGYTSVPELPPRFLS